MDGHPWRCWRCWRAGADSFSDRLTIDMHPHGPSVIGVSMPLVVDALIVMTTHRDAARARDHWLAQLRHCLAPSSLRPDQLSLMGRRSGGEIECTRYFTLAESGTATRSTQTAVNRPSAESFPALTVTWTSRSPIQGDSDQSKWLADRVRNLSETG